MLKILEDLVNLARERKINPIEGSYTNKLLEDKSLAKEKVIEEINELIEAVEKDSNKIFCCNLFIDEKKLVSANDTSKKKSEERASKLAFTILNIKY